MKILMVCLGNICRSPLAEGVARAKIEGKQLPWEVDSVGTSGWHIGKSPDVRSIDVARQHGIDISSLRGRQINKRDLEEYDLLVVMDAENYQNVRRLDPELAHGKLCMMMNFLHPGQNRPVPDPYYGGEKEFGEVYDLLDAACDAMIETIQNDH